MITFAILLAVALLPAAAGPFDIVRLRTEYKDDPAGIEVERPRLSWELVSTRRDHRQAAYRITVARSRESARAGSGEVWDSGRVASAHQNGIEYAGPRLGSGGRAFWRVQVWDEAGKSVTSPVAAWEMGLTAAGDWKARWIGIPTLGPQDTAPVVGDGVRWIGGIEDKQTISRLSVHFFRRRIALPDKAIVRATATVTAADQLVLHVNGQIAGGAREWKRLERIDITDFLVRGDNVVTAQVRHRPVPAGAFVGQIRIEFASGEPMVIDSDGRWTVSTRHQEGWLEPTFDDRAWKSAREIAALGTGPWAELKATQVRPQVGTPPAFLRKPFMLSRAVRRARLYATALGVYELALNGKRVGDQYFAPGWTDYNKRVAYQTYDVTSLLLRGDNVLGAAVAEGWYSGRIGWLGPNHEFYGSEPPKLLAQLEIEYADGERTRVVTDGTWKATAGPDTLADLMDGAHYDARRELGGWDKAGYDDGAWRAASVYENENRLLVADAGPPMRVVEELRPRAVAQPRPGVHVFDLGQNMVGWVRLRVRGPAGATVKLRFAEMLNPDGTIYVENLRAIRVTDRYTLKGGAEESWEPRFTFHGFRYVEVTGFPGKPGLGAITGRVVTSDTPTTGTLSTSNPMLNRLQHNIVWGQRGNFLSVPTDCPQRDERLGWMGDAQIFVRTACFNADVASFFTKWMVDVVDAQSPEGAFPDVAPLVLPDKLAAGAPGWGDAGVIVPWAMYDCYGDLRILATHYGAMARWVEYLRAANPDLLWTKKRGNDHGDWLSIDAPTDKGALATAYFAQTARMLGRIAGVLGKTDDAAKYEALFGRIRDAFRKAYVDDDGRIKSQTQTLYVLALRFDLMPEALRPAALAHLVSDIEARKNHLSTGFLGVGHLLPALTENGRLDVAYRLLMNDTFPSWGYSIKRGATTIWERWDGWTHDKGFQSPAMNSFNHYSLGSVGEWMYRTIGGIDTAAPGYEDIVIRPQPGGGLTAARAEVRSMKGPIKTEWTRMGGAFRLRVTVPMNARAAVYLPSADGHESNGGERQQDGGYRIGSGTYEFAARVSAAR